MAQADQIIKDEKVYIINAGKDQTRVIYVGYEEYEGNIFVRVKNESGTKIWTTIKGLACEEKNGKTRNITKQDLIKGEFLLLAKVTK